MPNIEFKSVDRLSTEDRLLVDLENLHRSGRPVDAKLIQFLGTRKVPFVPTISLTYEERKRLADEDSQRAYIDDVLEKRQTDWEKLRFALFEALKPVYRPFAVADFQACGGSRGRVLSFSQLLRPHLPREASQEMRAVAEHILPRQRLSRILSILGELLEAWRHYFPRLPAFERLNPYPRLNTLSIRLQPQIENNRFLHNGTALAWHATDTAYLYLAALDHLNKTRRGQGYPLSTIQYDITAERRSSEFYHYPDEYLVHAALGAALHPLGFCHTSVLEHFCHRPVLHRDGLQTEQDLMCAAISFSSHIARAHSEVPSLARAVVGAQAVYPNGKGWPTIKPGRSLHEFVLLFQAVEFYDTWTHPWYQRQNYSREDALTFLWNHSSYFDRMAVPIPAAATFDRALIEHFLGVLAPWPLGEKVYLFPADDLSTPHFVGRVYQYLKSYVPLISILKDERTGKIYPFGHFLLDIPNSCAYLMENRKVKRKIEQVWISRLRIHDITTNAADLEKFHHPLLERSCLGAADEQSPDDFTANAEDGPIPSGSR